MSSSNNTVFSKKWPDVNARNVILLIRFKLNNSISVIIILENAFCVPALKDLYQRQHFDGWMYIENIH